MTEDDISHLHGLELLAHDDEARERRARRRRYDAAFFMRAHARGAGPRVAAAGVNMPPKSTYFYPKVPTGLLFNPLALRPS